MTVPALYDDAVALLSAWEPDEASAQAYEPTMALLAQGPQVMWREHVAGHITASTLIVHHDRHRVLLCLHGRIGTWVQLGGHCEPGDATLAAAALREATEESGIAGLTLDPVPVNLHIHEVTCSIGPTRHFDVRFAALAPQGAAEQVSPESRALGWFAPGALPHPLGEGTAVLIRPSLARFPAAPAVR